MQPCLATVHAYMHIKTYQKAADSGLDPKMEFLHYLHKHTVCSDVHAAVGTLMALTIQKSLKSDIIVVEC